MQSQHWQILCRISFLYYILYIPTPQFSILFNLSSVNFCIKKDFLFPSQNRESNFCWHSRTSDIKCCSTDFLGQPKPSHAQHGKRSFQAQLRCPCNRGMSWMYKFAIYLLNDYHSTIINPLSLSLPHKV